MIEVRRNHRELMTDSKRTRDSAMRFYSIMISGVLGRKWLGRSCYIPGSFPRVGPDHIPTMRYRR